MSHEEPGKMTPSEQKTVADYPFHGIESVGCTLVGIGLSVITMYFMSIHHDLRTFPRIFVAQSLAYGVYLFLFSIPALFWAIASYYSVTAFIPGRGRIFILVSVAYDIAVLYFVSIEWEAYPDLHERNELSEIPFLWLLYLACFAIPHSLTWGLYLWRDPTTRRKWSPRQRMAVLAVIVAILVGSLDTALRWF